MRKSRLIRMARQFNENGLKFLLENPANVQELLRVTEYEFADRIAVLDDAPIIGNQALVVGGSAERDAEHPDAAFGGLHCGFGR